MKILHTATILLSVIISTGNLFAIDRDANMIDTARLDYNNFDHSDYFGLHITGENAVQDTDGKWAILAGVDGGKLSLDESPDFDVIGGEIGVKYYLKTLTSIAILGSYTWSNGDTFDYETPAITARIKQRFSQPDNSVSPYVKGEIEEQFVDSDLDNYNVAVFRAMLGCDFKMAEGYAFVFEGGISESDNLDNGADPEDGFLMTVAMQYDWN